MEMQARNEEAMVMVEPPGLTAEGVTADTHEQALAMAGLLQTQVGDENAKEMVEPLGPTAETHAQASGMDGPGDYYLAMKRLYKGDGMRRERAWTMFARVYQ